MKKIRNEFIGEEYFYEKHDSGLDIFLFPKKNYTTSYAAIGTNFGSVNKKFKMGSEIVETPEGIAHFLEHKLFECKDGDAFTLFSKTGARSNACTSFKKTQYWFSCNDQLEESLAILLNFVQEPYFTEQGVSKERGIIEQEIKMYCDDPEWQSELLLINALYKNHFVKDDIAGSVESISKITPDLLNKCYDAFYNFSNMTMCLVGNFDENKILSFINSHISKKYAKFDTETIFPDEPEDINQKFVSKKMEVVTPIFAVGFKHNVIDKDIKLKNFISHELALESICLKSGKLYNDLIEKNLITSDNLDSELFHGPFYKSSIFSGESKNPKETSKIIIDYVMNYVSKGIPEDEFERAKKCYYANTISLFDKVSSIGSLIMSLNFMNIDIFDFVNEIHNISIDDVNSELKNFSEDRCSVCEII